MGTDQNQPISTNAKPTVTEGRDVRNIAEIPSRLAIVHHHKVIACALVLVKGN
jgi:hypothetical protein